MSSIFQKYLEVVFIKKYILSNYTFNIEFLNIKIGGRLYFPIIIFVKQWTLKSYILRFKLNNPFDLSFYD